MDNLWNTSYNRSVATTKPGKLKQLYTQLPAGTPLSSADLADLGISADLAVHYARSGWLTRLARGVYCRPGDPLALYPSLNLLQRKIEGFHVGGKTALEWYGFRHYVLQRSTVYLYGWEDARLPSWFLSRFPGEYHRKRLFDEQPGKPLKVDHYESRDNAPLVSTPERALLELLSEVGVRQPLPEASEIIESTYAMRADALNELLMRCKSVKTVRLCVKLGHELNLPWVSKLDAKKLPTGSDRSWVSQSKDGLLVLKP